LANQEYTNVFVDVHNKVRAFKDRLREANKGDAEHRENRLVQEAKQMEITDKKSASLNSPTLPSSDPV
jgi:hypothetical protein